MLAARDFDLCGFRTCDVVRRPSADEPRLELRLHHHITLALRHRLVLLVLDVREADPRHLADDDTPVFHLRSDVESLHRLVEVRLHHRARLQPAPGADDQQHGHAGGDGADDEQSQLEVVRFLAHGPHARGSRHCAAPKGQFASWDGDASSRRGPRAADRRPTRVVTQADSRATILRGDQGRGPTTFGRRFHGGGLGFAVEELAHPGSVLSRSLRGSPSATIPFLRRSSMITRSAIEKMLGSS